MSEKTYSDPLYGAQRQLTRRSRILKRLGVQRQSIPARIQHGEENVPKVPKVPEDADKKQKVLWEKLIANHKKEVESLKADQEELLTLESAISRLGFTINDRFTGRETVSTLSPVVAAETT